MNIPSVLKKIILKREKIDDFVVLRADGGLGSQILSYALSLKIKMATGKSVKFDTSWYSLCGKDCDKKHSRMFTIKKLFPNIDFQIASDREIYIYKKYFRYKNHYTWKYNGCIFKSLSPTYFDGYYSHWKYWSGIEKQLIADLDFSDWPLTSPNAEIAGEINESPYSVALHVRRGDFVKLGWCFISDNYYVNAVKYIQSIVGKRIKAFIFSNDAPYVKNNLLKQLDFADCRIVDVNDNDSGHFDLYLMSLCKSVIAANSTFSIAAGILNKNCNFNNSDRRNMVIVPHSWGYGDSRKRMYTGMDESIRNPDYVVFNAKTGECVSETNNLNKK